MKNWWDQNITSGFAYEFKERPIPLLKEKTAKVITTTGAKKIIYIVSGLYFSMKSIWKYAKLGFCGIKLENFTLIEDFGSNEKRDEKGALEKIANLVK